jgi:hypothetical protein
MRVRGFVAGCGGCGDVSSFTTDPSWLFDPLGYSAFWLAATPPAPETDNIATGVEIDPGQPLTVPPIGTRVELTGHFADPAATSCRIIPRPGYVGGLAPAVSAVARCMRAFVATGIRRL